MTGKKFSVSIFVFILFLILGACNQTDKQTGDTNGTEVSEESAQVTYESDVEGIIKQSCISCHGGDAPSLTEFKADKEKYIGMSKGPRLDNYDDLLILVNGDDAGALMRRLDDGSNKDDGEPGNMYSKLGSTEEERQEKLATIKEWVGSWNLKHSDELSEEERAEITAVRK